MNGIKTRNRSSLHVTLKIRFKVAILNEAWIAFHSDYFDAWYIFNLLVENFEL